MNHLSHLLETSFQIHWIFVSLVPVTYSLFTTALMIGYLLVTELFHHVILLLLSLGSKYALEPLHFKRYIAYITRANVL